MKHHDKYLFETFRSDSSDFDSRFTEYLNDKHSGDWKVKNCSLHRESNDMMASCLFKRRS